MNSRQSVYLTWICFCIIFFFAAVTGIQASPLPQVWVEETGHSIFPSRFMPAEGQVHTLVIPVEFSDFTFDTDPEPLLEAAFNGIGLSSAPSAADYFARASYGKMQFSAGIQPVISLPEPRSRYENHSVLIRTLLEELTQRGVDLSQYDSNRDGVLDGLYLVWAGQPQGAGTSWWPYSDTYYSDFITSGIQIGSYSSLSYQLLTDSSTFRQMTVIHETGHQLGLTDYYASSYTGGTGAAVMMDRNEGDEDCFSKLLLGWTEPQILRESAYATLSSASVSSDALLIAPPGWQGNYLSEYFMVEYVTPEANQSNQSLSADGGIRIWHVNAATSLWTDDITAVMYRYDNSGDGPKLLTIVDPSRQWYEAGSRVEEEQMRLWSGEDTGISLRVEEMDGQTARICVLYQGIEPALPEIAEGSSFAEESPEPASTAQEEEPESIGTDDEPETVQTEQPEVMQSSDAMDPLPEEPGQTTSTHLSSPVPVLIILILAVLIYFLLSGRKNSKNKKNKQKKKRK